MASVTEEQLAVAQVYSSAMIALAEKVGETDNLLSELEELSSLIERTPELERFFMIPIVDEEARGKSIEKIFRGRMSDLLVNSLQILNRKNRMSLIHAVIKAYRHEHRKRAGHVEVFVRSAVPLTDEQRQDLREAVKRQTDSVPDLIETVDDSLIGGLIVQIGDRKLDTSVARKLRRFADILHQRSGQELARTEAYVTELPA